MCRNSVQENVRAGRCAAIRDIWKNPGNRMCSFKSVIIIIYWQMHITEQKDACGLVLDNGMELLLHIGIDTVEMQGDGFEYLIKEGQEVKAGTPLIRFNRQKIKEAGYSDVTVCVITDGADEKTVHFHTGIYAQENETVIIEIE